MWDAGGGPSIFGAGDVRLYDASSGVGQSNAGQLFRVDPATGTADKVDLGDAKLTNANSLELRGHLLYVVRNANNLITVVRLRSQLTRGVVLGEISGGLDFPSSATVAAGRLRAVNARFGTPPTPDKEYWITQLPLRPENG